MVLVDSFPVMSRDRPTARTGGPPLNVVTADALAYADLFQNCIDAGSSVAELASDFGVERVVVEWWLAIARLKAPYWGGEIFHLAKRGALAVEIADRFGIPDVVARRMVTSYHARRRARKTALWEFSQVYG